MRKYLIAAATGLLTVGLLATPAAATENKHCPDHNAETVTKVEGKHNSVVLPAGTVFCVKTGKNGAPLGFHTGQLTADGVHPLSHYVTKDVSYYVVYQTPPPPNNGTDGEDGEDGKDGLTPTIICYPGVGLGFIFQAEDEVFVNLETEYVLEQGQVCPLAGADGQDGADGADGSDGADGKDGQDGNNGTDGVDGSTHYCITPDGHPFTTPDCDGADYQPHIDELEARIRALETTPAPTPEPGPNVNPTPTNPPAELPHTGLGDWILWAGLIAGAAGLTLLLLGRLFNRPDNTQDA